MFKRIFSMIAVASLLAVSSASAFAATTEACVPPITASFVEEATVSVVQLNEGCFEISLSKTEPLAVDTCVVDNEQVSRHSVLTLLAESVKEKEDVLSRIDLARRGGGTIYDDDTFFGSTCYIYVSVTFTTRSSPIGQEARMNSVSTRYRVNSGTYVSSANLHLACVGTSSSSGAVYNEHDIAVTASSYTTTYPDSWPYIYNGSACLGASFTVTAKRPSGESSTNTVSANVYLN